MPRTTNYFEGPRSQHDVAFLLGIKDIAAQAASPEAFEDLQRRPRRARRLVGSKNYYIADNSFVGRHDPDKMMSWIGAIWSKFPVPGAPHLGICIKVYGQGHVVAHN